MTSAYHHAQWPTARPGEGRLGRAAARVAVATGAALTLLAAGSAPGATAALIPTGPVTTVTVGGHAWRDADCDGFRDVGEGPLADVVVTPSPVGVAVLTDATGAYAFRVNAGAKQSFFFSAPAASGLVLAPANATGNVSNNPVTDVADSDPEPSNGLLSITAPTLGNDSLLTPDNPYLDAGFCEPIPTEGYNLALAKVLDPNQAALRPGGEVSFLLTATNVGTAAGASGIRVVDLLPAELTPVSASGSGFTCEWASGPRSYTCTSAIELAPGQSAPTVTVVGKLAVSYSGSMRNVAYVAPTGTEAETLPLGDPPTRDTKTGATRTDNDAEAWTRFTGNACAGDLVWLDVDRDGVQDKDEPGVGGVTVTLYYYLQKFGGGAWVRWGDPVTTSSAAGSLGHYSFDGLYPYAYERYKVVFTAPTGMRFTVAHLGGSPSLDSDAVVTAPEWTIGSAEFGGPTAPDGVVPCNLDLDAGLVALDLSVTKVADRATAVSGDEIVWTVTPHNDGPVDAYPQWSVTDLVPAGVTVLSMEGEGYLCGEGTCISDQWLRAGADGPALTIRTRIDADTVGTLTNTATISPSAKDLADTDPSDNSASALVVVTAPPPPPPVDPDDEDGDPEPEPQTEELPATGADSLSGLVAGVGLALAGASLLVLRRRFGGAESR